MRLSNRIIIIMLLPIEVFLWLIGWSLFWAGSQGKSQRIQTASETDALIAPNIFLEEYEECNTPTPF
jgi:hypothetical protein